MSYFAMEVASPLNYASMNDTAALALVLSAVQIIAMANHPSLPHLLYTLYGTGSSSFSSGYTQYVLQTWDVQATGRTILANVSLFADPVCAPVCQMEVSGSLLSIESKSAALVFPLASTTKQVKTGTPLRTYTKTAQIYGQLDIYKLVAVHKSYAIHYLSPSQLQMTLFDLTANTHSITVYSITSAGKPLKIQISDSWVYFASNKSSLTISYACAACMEAGQYTNNSVLPFTSISTTYLATQYLEMATGTVTLGESVWVDADNKVYRFLVEGAGNHKQLAGLPGTNYQIYAANSQVVLFKEGSFYSMHSYEPLAEATLTELALFPILNANHQLVAVNSDSTLLSVYEFISAGSSNTQAVTQYQIIGDCSKYEATVSNSTICNCHQFDAIFCRSITSQELSESLSTKIIITAVTVMLAVGVIAGVGYALFKKVFSRAAKRTPYVYEQVDLMAFQV